MNLKPILRSFSILLILSIHRINASCVDPPQIENGYLKIEKDSYETGDSVNYDCEIGHYRELNGGRATAVCNENGDWTKSDITCSPIQCPRLENPQYGRIVGTEVAFGSEVTFECNAGYYRWTKFGIMQSVCREDRTWNGPEFQCRPVNCPELQDVDNGLVNPKTGVYKERVEYQCDAGFTLKGDKIRECLVNGQWSSSEPQCLVVISVEGCPSPLSKDFTRKFKHLKTNIAIGIKVGHTVTFICKNDETLRLESKCESDGNWTPPPPTIGFCTVETTTETTTETTAETNTEPTETTETTKTTKTLLITTATPPVEVTISQDPALETTSASIRIEETTETISTTVDTSVTKDDVTEKEEPGEDNNFPAWLIVLISLSFAAIIVAIISFVLMKKLRKTGPEKDKTDAEMESIANNRAHLAMRGVDVNSAANNSVQKESAVNNLGEEIEPLTNSNKFV